jgi:uncharacterized protein (DUF3084 family)
MLRPNWSCRLDKHGLVSASSKQRTHRQEVRELRQELLGARQDLRRLRKSSRGVQTETTVELGEKACGRCT